MGQEFKSILFRGRGENVLSQATLPSLKGFYLADVLTAADQEIPDCLGEAETAVGLGSKYWWGLT